MINTEKQPFSSFLNDINSVLDEAVRKYKRCSVLKKDGKTILVFEVPGIEEKDVSVKLLEDTYNIYTKEIDLEISASTYNDIVDKTYSIYELFPVRMDSYKEITYSVKNGLLMVELIVNVPDVSKVKVSRK